jgi:hypothetical protein
MADVASDRATAIDEEKRVAEGSSGIYQSALMVPI